MPEPGPLGRVVVETLSRLVAEESVKAAVIDALGNASLPEIPEDPGTLAGFLAGALYDAVAIRLGQDTAEAMLMDLTPIVERAASSMTAAPSGVRQATRPQPRPIAAPKPMTLVATNDQASADALQQWITDKEQIRVVEDVFELLHGVEQHASAPKLTVVLDCRMPAVRPATLVSLAGIIPPTVRVVLWGWNEQLQDAHGAAATERGWHRVSAEVHLKDVVERHSQVMRAVTEERTPATGRRVLIASSDEDDRVMLGRVLTARGHRVVCASDGYLALTLCMEKRVDAVIADEDIPILAGAKLAHVLSEMMGPAAPVFLLRTVTPIASLPGRAVAVPKLEGPASLLAVMEAAFADAPSGSS